MHGLHPPYLRRCGNTAKKFLIRRLLLNSIDRSTCKFQHDATSIRISSSIMEPKSLSSNWKKLQVTLKSSSTGKENKTTKLGNNLKRKRVEAISEKPANRPRKFSKIRNMTDTDHSDILPGDQRRSSLVASQSGVSLKTETQQPRDGKVNEGLNETYVDIIILSNVLKVLYAI